MSQLSTSSSPAKNGHISTLVGTHCGRMRLRLIPGNHFSTTDLAIAVRKNSGNGLLLDLIAVGKVHAHPTSAGISRDKRGRQHHILIPSIISRHVFISIEEEMLVRGYLRRSRCHSSLTGIRSGDGYYAPRRRVSWKTLDNIDSSRCQLPSHHTYGLARSRLSKVAFFKT